MNYIVNYDISDRLLQFLSIRDIIHLMRLNHSFHQLVVSTKLFSELVILKLHSKNKLKWFVPLNLLTVLRKLDWKKINYNDCDPLYEAAVTGQVMALNYFKSIGCQFNCAHQCNMLNLLAEKGCLIALDWLKLNGYQLVPFQYVDLESKEYVRGYKLNNNYLFYTTRAIDKAAANNHLAILNWFHSNNYPVKYTEYAIDNAARYGHLMVLDWFKINGYPLKYTKEAIENAAGYGQVAVLDWFHSNNYPLKYTGDAIAFAAENNHLAVLDWFRNNGYPLKYTNDTMDWTIKMANLQVLHWFENNGYPLNTSDTIN